MIKLSQKGFAALEVVLIVITLAAIGTAGYFAYQARHDKTDSSVNVNEKQAASEEAQPATKPLSEDEQILRAAKCPNTCTIVHKQGTIADVLGSDEASVHVFVSKKSGSWQVVYQGNGDVPADVVAEHGIPEEWLGPQLTD